MLTNKEIKLAAYYFFTKSGEWSRHIDVFDFYITLDPFNHKWIWLNKVSKELDIKSYKTIRAAHKAAMKYIKENQK